MKETDAEEDKWRLDCPVCRKTIINFDGEEWFSDLCSHVALSYSFALSEFRDIDESMKEVVTAMEKRIEENEEHVQDDNYENITMIDLIKEYAEKSNGKYQVFSIDDPNSEPPLYETIYFLIKMTDKKKLKKTKNVNK